MFWEVLWPLGFGFPMSADSGQGQGGRVEVTIGGIEMLRPMERAQAARHEMVHDHHGYHHH